MYYLKPLHIDTLEQLGFDWINQRYTAQYFDSLLKPETINQVAISSVIEAVVMVAFDSSAMFKRNVNGSIELLSAAPFESVKSLFRCDETLLIDDIKNKVQIGAMLLPGIEVTMITIPAELMDKAYPRASKE